MREQVLRGLGWTILRVWSTDWWFDAGGCAERLNAQLQRLLDDDRISRAAKVAQTPDEAPPVAAHWDMGHEVEAIEEIRDEDIPEPIEEVVPRPTASEAELVAAVPKVSPAAPALAKHEAAETEAADADAGLRYRVADLSSFAADPDQFFEFAYRDTLKGMIEAVIEAESPLRSDILAQRIARAHGWLRTGGRIREQIDLHLRGLDMTQESSGAFLWKKGTVSEIAPYRPPAGEDARRSIADIPLAELASVVLDNPALLDETDPARHLARLLGVERQLRFGLVEAAVHLFEHGDEQAFLAAEVVVDHPVVRLRRLRDLIDAPPRETVFGELAGRRPQDGFSCGLGREFAHAHCTRRRRGRCCDIGGNHHCSAEWLFVAGSHGNSVLCAFRIGSTRRVEGSVVRMHILLHGCCAPCSIATRLVNAT